MTNVHSYFDKYYNIHRKTKNIIIQYVASNFLEFFAYSTAFD